MTRIHLLSSTDVSRVLALVALRSHSETRAIRVPFGTRFEDPHHPVTQGFMYPGLWPTTDGAPLEVSDGVLASDSSIVMQQCGRLDCVRSSEEIGSDSRKQTVSST